MEYIKYRDALRKLADANTDNEFNKVMYRCYISLLASEITADEFEAICNVASVLNFVSYCAYAKRIFEMKKENIISETLA